MSLAQSIVVHIVSRSNLQAASTKLDVNIAVLYHWDNAVYQRNNHLVTLQPLVLHVLRVYAHSRIAHDGLRTCGSHNSIIALLVLVEHLALSASQLNRVRVSISYVILQVVELRLLLSVYHLFGREHRLSLWVPVHHAQTSVDVALVVKVNKHLHHRLRALLVHSESRTVPVA